MWGIVIVIWNEVGINNYNYTLLDLSKLVIQFMIKLIVWPEKGPLRFNTEV